MTLREALRAVGAQEDLNFLLTNRIPRRAATLFMGWFSRIEQPLVRDASLALWRIFSELELDDAQHRDFRSLQDCFTRQLREGARPIDPDPSVLCSPCDAIVGESGRVESGTVYQAKGFPYRLRDLLPDGSLAEAYEGGRYVTLRLTSGMYHRFHAPQDLDVSRVTYISGDTWNVNPIALQRVERLFCRNERAVIETVLRGTGELPFAAILVASLRLKFLDVRLHLRYRGPNVIPCRASLTRGEEMGWFEQGSTIIVFAPSSYCLAAGLAPGQRIRMGQALLRREDAPRCD